MVFHEKYELLALRGGDQEITLPGIEISSKRPVLVHLLAAGYTPENRELLRIIIELSAENQRRVLETGDHDGIPYVVTDILPESLSLRNWVTAGAAAKPEPGEFTRMFQAAAKPAQAKSEAGAGESEPGEFTRLFRSPSGAATATPEPRPVAETLATPPAPEAPPAAPAVPRATEAAESTRLFQAPPAPPAPDPMATGDFTLMMRSPLAPEPVRPKAAPLSADPPGGFTQMMQGGFPKPPAAGPAPPASPARKPVPAGESFDSQSDFTRIFGPDAPASDSLTQPAAPQVPLPQGGQATGVFSRRPVPPAPEAAPGPGEFTRMFSAPSPPPVSAPKPTQPAPAATPAKSYLPLILILGGLFLLAVILILVFALAR